MKYLQQFVTTNLNVGGGIDDSQTTGIVFQSLNNVDATKPSVACLTWADPLDTDVAEWITYDSINSTTNELQGVTRGAEGYSAKAHLNQAVVAFPLSKSHVNELNTALTSSAGAIASTIDDDTMATASATALATSESIKAYVDTEVAGVSNTDGWTASANTWTYASASSFTIAGTDLTTVFTKGTKIKLTQTTAKYFYVTSSSFSTDTTVNITGGSDYTLANAAITTPYYSYADRPQGFPSFFNYTATVGGTASGTCTPRFSISGNLVSINFDTGSQTSNANTFTLTLPVTASSSMNTCAGTLGYAKDNGSNKTGATKWQIAASASTVSLYTDMVVAVWTTSGIKQAIGVLFYEI